MLRGAIRTLLILRHAKAETGEGLRDEDRRLTKRGRRAAERVGELISDRLPELVLSSTSERTRETVARFTKAAAYFGPIEYLEELYLAEPSTIVEVVAARGGDAERVLVVGHNPGLEDLVSRLSGEQVTLPTAALAECTLDIERWADLGLGAHAELIGLAYPRDDD
jgi:phosphohistidine phosphatase